jgi:signal transduction histidine kinase
MVDDLLVLFALESGVLPFEPQPLELAQAVDDAVDRLASRFPRHTFAVRFEEGSIVNADVEHVDRILGTMLFNACRLSPEGGEVLIDGRNASDAVTVSVSDGGPGLSEEELAGAFERHSPSRAIERSEVRSTGLELYKIRRLVELHGGAVTAERRPEGGSTFSFTLPQ